MKEIIRKLSSRKLWMALAGVFVGIATVLGAEGGDIDAVAGAVTALASVVTYIITEGKIDAESVKNAIVEIEEATDTINKVGF